MREEHFEKKFTELASRKSAAVDLIARYGGIDGDHHKQWVLDQVLRMLLEHDYAEWIEDYNDPEEGYEWDVGIAP